MTSLRGGGEATPITLSLSQATVTSLIWTASALTKCSRLVVCGLQAGSNLFVRIFRRAQTRSRVSRHLRIFRLGLGRCRDRRT